MFEKVNRQLLYSTELYELLNFFRFMAITIVI